MLKQFEFYSTDIWSLCKVIFNQEVRTKIYILFVVVRQISDFSFKLLYKLKTESKWCSGKPHWHWQDPVTSLRFSGLARNQEGPGGTQQTGWDC